MAALRATSAKNTITTGESAKRSRSLLVRVTTAVKRHTAALEANANHERKPRNSVLLKGYHFLLCLKFAQNRESLFTIFASFV